MKTSSLKAKGRRLAQAAKEAILATHPTLEDADLVVTPSGVTGPDIMLSPKAAKVFPFLVECKNRETLNIWDSLKQASKHILKGYNLYPLLIFSRNHSKIYVAMELEHFLKLRHEEVNKS